MELYQLRQKQSLTLEQKIELSKGIIKEFYEQQNGKVYISFSGGKDSTVLLNLVREIFPDVEAVFSDTGLEYPEIKDFVKTFKNVTIVRPEKNFKQVIEEYGYPVISKKTARMINDLQNPSNTNENSRKLYLTGEKQDGTLTKSFKLAKKWHKLIDAPFKVSNKCCDITKKEPLKKYEKQTGNKPFIGTMASDSMQRESSYLKTGCINSGKSCQPLAIWLEKDIWDYIRKYNLEYAKVYDMGVKRTGCVYCMFGVHLEKGENRFQQMKKSHPELYSYCMEKLNLKEILDYIDIKY